MPTGSLAYRLPVVKEECLPVVCMHARSPDDCTDPALPARDLSVVATEMPLRPDLFAVRDRGAEEARRPARQLAGSSETAALPPASSGRPRPCAVVTDRTHVYVARNSSHNRSVRPPWVRTSSAVIAIALAAISITSCPRSDPDASVNSREWPATSSSAILMYA